MLCDKLGKPEWESKEKFATNGARVKNRVELEALIETETRTRTTAEWLEIFNESGMPYAAINDIQTTLGHEQGKGSICLARIDSSAFAAILADTMALVLARDMVKEVEHPACGPIKLVNTPVKFSHSEPRIRMPPPLLGQHTHEILSRLVGLTDAEIESLKEEGVVA